MHWDIVLIQCKIVLEHLGPVAIPGKGTEANMTSLLSGEVPMEVKTNTHDSDGKAHQHSGWNIITGRFFNVNGLLMTIEKTPTGELTQRILPG